MNRHYIFWAHSPIGYETYLALKQAGIFNADNSTLITAREFSPPEAALCIGLPEEYVWQSEEQFQKTQKSITQLIERLNINDEGYELFIPQSANFYIRGLIESSFCKSFVFFDEGSSARNLLFKRRCTPGFYKYNIRESEAFEDFVGRLNIDRQVMIKSYSEGVPFYDVNHSKCAGYVSFFNDVFLGHEVDILTKVIPTAVDICSQYGLILLPPFNYWAKTADFVKKFQIFLNSVNSIIKLNTKKRWLLKFHPHDGVDIKNKIASYFPCELFESFCAKNHILSYREPAFMGFDCYVGSPNSTFEFLKHDRHQYIAIPI